MQKAVVPVLVMMNNHSLKRNVKDSVIIFMNIFLFEHYFLFHSLLVTIVTVAFYSISYCKLPL